MRDLASKMSDAYMDVFWDDLKIIAMERFNVQPKNFVNTN